mmetsp:Transcript_2731/g.4635  ORF Transcript_2731/g.4635 Transcript_2731/m.4635 type:complete len:281 (-) Transcript_2731:514-1356(-)
MPASSRESEPASRPRSSPMATTGGSPLGPTRAGPTPSKFSTQPIRASGAAISKGSLNAFIVLVPSSASAVAHDFDATVALHVRRRIVRGDRATLSVADLTGHASTDGARDIGHGAGATTAQAHVVFVRSAAVGMAVDRIGIGPGLAEELLQMRASGAGEPRAVGVKQRVGVGDAAGVHVEADGHPVLGVHAAFHVAFDTAVGDPVQATVRIDPETGLNLPANNDLLLCRDRGRGGRKRPRNQDSNAKRTCQSSRKPAFQSVDHSCIPLMFLQVNAMLSRP